MNVVLKYEGCIDLCYISFYLLPMCRIWLLSLVVFLMVGNRRKMTWLQQEREVGKGNLQNLDELYVLEQSGSMGSVPSLH
jgi:hypothetical protein